MKQIDFARHIGVAKSYVTELKKAGRLVMSADGKRVEVEASIARIEATAAGRADVTTRHAQQRGAELPKAAQATPRQEAEIDSADLGIDDTGRAKAKTLLLHYENGSIKIEMALRRGMRYERAAVKREAADLGAMLRAGIERVIDQTAPRLAASGDAAERRRILEAEIHRMRRMIKRELPRALRRMREAGEGKS